MADQASFIAALIDRVSGPARKMKGQLTSLSKAFRDVNKNAKRDELGRFVGRSGGMLKRLEGSFKGAGKSLAGAVESGVGHLKNGLVLGGVAVAGVAAGVGAATVKMAMFGQESELAFKQLAKHGASGTKLFNHARGVAEQFGLDVIQTTDQFKQLLAVQFNPKVATDILKMGADMRVLGQDGEKVAGIVTALGQIKSKGRLQAEELMQLNERSISADLVKGQLAEAMGVDRSSIDGLISQGKVGADMAIQAILSAVKQKLGEKNLGDAGQLFADTMLDGMFGKLKAKAQNRLTDIGKKITPALEGAFGAISGELSSLLDNKSFQEGIVVAFETIGTLVREAVPFVKEFVGSLGDGFKEAWPAMKAVIDDLFTGFGSGGKSGWMANVKEFGKTLGQVAAIGVTIATVFGGMVVAGIQLVTAAVQIAGYMWEGLIKGIGATVFAIDDFFANVAAKWRAFDFGALANSLIEGLVNGINNGAQWVLDTIGNLGKGMLKKFENVLAIGSPSKEFEYFGQMSGLGFSQGLEGGLNANDNDVLLPSFKGSVGSLMGAGGGGGGGDVNVYVEINIDGAGDPKEVANEMRQAFLTKVSGALEQIAAGAAA